MAWASGDLPEIFGRCACSHASRSSKIGLTVTPYETITSGNPDAKAAFFRDKLTEAIDYLEPPFESGCDRETALKCWDKVYNTTFFIERFEPESETSSAVTSLAIASSALLSSAAAAAGAVNSAGGSRHA